MKKILSLILALAMVVTMMSLVGCGEKKAASLKLGLGVHSTVEKATSADGDTQGVGQAAVNVAGILMDADGKIVKCVIDVADNTVNFTADGKAVEAKEFKTKYELGENYGMKAYGGAKKEWFEQIDALVALIEGKTYEEVLALLGENKKGNDDVISAGCTIMISDVIEAIKAAVKNAKDSGATADDTLKLGIVSTQSGAADATEDKEGANGFDVSIALTAKSSDGKVTAADSDVVSAAFAFDTKGVTSEEKASAKSKKMAGDNYGMAAYGQDLNGDGTVKEWYVQADELNKACIGKTADEISALAVESGYGSEDLQKAGCTINVSDMVKAAVKSAK